MSMTTVRASWRRTAALPAFALVFSGLTQLAPCPMALAAATTAAPLAVASTSATTGLVVTLAGNSPMLTPGGEPAEFVATVGNSANRELSGVRLSFSTVPANPQARTHWYADGDLRVQVATGTGWQQVPLAPTATRTAYHGTLSVNPGLTVPAGDRRQIRFRLALALSASGVPGPSEFTVEAIAADGALRAAASRDYTATADPAATPVGERVSAGPTDSPGVVHHHRHSLARAGDATGTIAAVVAVAAVFGLGAVAFGLGTRRRRRGEH